MNPNSAKFHHFDRHQGQTVAGLSSGISSARSQALTEHGSGGRFPFLSQQFRWTRTCHLGFRNTVGRLLLEEQAIHGHGIASISIGWPVFLWGSGIRPTSVALCARLWAAMPGSLVFFLDGRGGAECWDDRLSSSELDRMVDSKKTQMAMDQYLWKYHF